VVSKIQAMLKAGVQSCWFVQPVIRAVTVFAPGEESRTVTDGTLEDPATGITLDVAALFKKA
jgi:hypothetical protein